jgi:hypothetical protein
MQKSFEPDSTVTSDSDKQSLKHMAQSFSTLDGMQIDESNEQSENARDSINES